MSKKLGEWVVKARIPLLIIATLLLIPSVIGYNATKVNYDMLVYLPKDIETMQGQDILEDEFQTGAFAPLVVENMPAKETARLKADIEKVDHVKTVLWYDSVMDLSVPMDLLPDEIYEKFNTDDATMMFIIFDQTTSEDGTIEACREIRKLCDEHSFLAGMTVGLIDTQELADKEAPIYVAIAVILCMITLSLAMDSWLIPFLFMISIGYAVLYNMGTNLFLGQISYLTKAIAAVLQLGVTMDYSIFLWHSFEHYLRNGNASNEAMENAISDTFNSIIGSSVTTIAGFIALCFMSFTLGKDIGLVMAKGVLFGVVSCVTVLPALILVFQKPLLKTTHKALIPDFHGLGKKVTSHWKLNLAICLILLGPAVYGYTHYNVYYKLDSSLPRDLPAVIANTKVEDEFHNSTTDVLMINASVPAKDIQKMASEMEDVDGVNWVLGLNTIKGAGIPEEMIPEELKSSLMNEEWQLLMINSSYQVASDEINAQCDTLNAIAKKYDEKAMLIGEAPATKDLITISNADFGKVDSASIGIIFFIIAMVFGSASVPVVLVSVIEFGIFVNLAVSCVTGTTLPFIAGTIVSTIQLGSTVDYAILLTNRYLDNRAAGEEKQKAISDALQASVKSIFTSAVSFFAATAGVGIYSDIDIISSLCILMARGALISMGCVLFILPSFLMVFDRFICRHTKRTKNVVQFS